MRKTLSARRGGFTLVELLIVVIIIGILAGMMMLTMGSATDGATAARIISDLRNIKSAALLYYLDNTAWPEPNGGGDVVSLDRYLDRPAAQFDAKIYVPGITAVEVTVSGQDRVLYGLTLAGTVGTGVQTKIAENGAVSSAAGTPYVSGTAVYIAGH
ncbi:hypothetical protein FACS1894167_08130 [Synergistales bacterium]|nr:hypothetical protein FACS1894167_08130 [Synergistales bacterium]